MALSEKTPFSKTLESLDPLNAWENQMPADKFENFEVWMFRSPRNDKKISDN